MILIRDSCCDICKERTDLVVDHSHRTGEVRGLLCPKCNQGLGSFKDNIQTLNNAIEYLEKENNNGKLFN